MLTAKNLSIHLQKCIMIGKQKYTCVILTQFRMKPWSLMVHTQTKKLTTKTYLNTFSRVSRSCLFFKWPWLTELKFIAATKISKLQVRVITKGISNYISTGHIQCDIWIICNSVIKMPPLYPRNNNNGFKNNNCIVQENKWWNNSWNSKEGQKIIARVCAQKFWKLKKLK